MEITKNPHGGIIMKFNKSKLLIDPSFSKETDLSECKDINCVLFSDTFYDSPVKIADCKFFSWPGEFEVSGISVVSMDLDQSMESASPRKNLLLISCDGIKTVYIKGLKKELTSDQIEKIGDIDLLIVADTEAEKVLSTTIEEIEPKAFLPLITEEEKDVFFGKLSYTTVDCTQKITIGGKSDLLSEKMSVFLLC